MARDIGRRFNKTVRLPVVLKAAAVTVGHSDGSTWPAGIEAPAQSPAEPECLIWFNPRDLEDYRYAIRQLQAAVLVHHGPDTLRRLLQEETPSTKRAFQEARNDRLLAEYIRSGLSVGKCAAMLAEKNKTLPRESRYGPSGSTTAKTLEKQIDRLKDEIWDPRRRKYIEWLASQLAQWVPAGP
jgi:hypothetical protein